MRETTYSIASRGLATSFTESEIPIDFSSVFKNRTINAAGGAEKRQGIEELNFPATITGATINRVHEFVDNDGVALMFVTGGGRIFKWDGSAWEQVHAFSSTSATIRSVQFGDKMIFYNGVDRTVATEDKGATFRELVALIERGEIASATTTSLTDADVSAWSATDVNVNDLAYNVTTGAYGVVTQVSGSVVRFTAMGSGATGIGKVSANPANGNAYQIHDLVELNIIPGDDVPDNVAAAASGTSSTVIAVSAVNFSDTEIRVGDIVYNTTRAATTTVEAVATAVTVTSVASQAAGDSLIFLKSAMPITAYAHIHFGRLYHIDARDRRKVRISGANDPEDMTTDGAVLDPITFNYELSSRGDILKSIGTYQRFIVFAGRRAIYVYEGTTPIGENPDFSPLGSFPIGVVSPDGLLDIGNDILFLTDDGMQSLRIVVDANAVTNANVAEPIRVTLRDLIRTTNEADLQLIHYPRRSWVLVKVGSQIYCYNYTTGVSQPDDVYGGSWSLFDGLFAQQKGYLSRSNGDIVCGGAGGTLYDFDQGSYGDLGQPIQTEYRTGWLTTESPSSSTVRIKEGKYIKPLFEVGASIEYQISVEGGFNGQGNDSSDITPGSVLSVVGVAAVGTAVIGGSKTANVKTPLRWRGEVARLTFRTESTLGPDVLGRYTLYTNIRGRR